MEQVSAPLTFDIAHPQPPQQITPTQVFLLYYYYFFFFFLHNSPVCKRASACLTLNSLSPDVGRLAASRCKKSGVSCCDECQLGEISPLRAHKRDKWHLRYSGMTDETISCNGNSLFFSPAAAPPTPSDSFLRHIEIFMLCLKAIFIWRIKLLWCIVSPCFRPGASSGFLRIWNANSSKGKITTDCPKSRSDLLQLIGLIIHISTIDISRQIIRKETTDVYSYQRGCC